MQRAASRTVIGRCSDRMQIASLLGLVELRPNRERRPTPPESAEHVRRATLLAQPACGRYVRAALCQIEPPLALLGDRLITFDAEQSRVSGLCQSLPVGFSAARPPRRGTSPLLLAGRCLAGWPVCALRPGDRPEPRPYDDRSAPGLRHPVVGGVQYATLNDETQSRSAAFLKRWYSADRSSSGTFSMMKASGSAPSKRAGTPAKDPYGRGPPPAY